MERILVVDDIPDNILLLQFVLEQEGYQVEVASSGREALAMVEAQPPHLVLLDVMMPEMNGFEVTQHMRQNHRLAFIPILLITGYDHVDANAFGVAPCDLVRKPIDFDILLNRIQTILPKN